MKYKVNDIFVLGNGSIWKIVKIVEEDHYPITCEYISGPLDDEFTLNEAKCETFTKDLCLFDVEDWIIDDEDRMLIDYYSIDKIIDIKLNPEYFL